MVALTFAPTAHADMLVGNYRLEIHAIPQPNGPAAPYAGDAYLSNGRYAMTVDVPDGVRCVVQFFPPHDVYSWDAVSLAGQVVSTSDTGSGGGPGGTNT